MSRDFQFGINFNLNKLNRFCQLTQEIKALFLPNVAFELLAHLIRVQLVSALIINPVVQLWTEFYVVFLSHFLKHWYIAL